ncbi:MAG: hypothetical protein CMO80_03990 [Verrucomicrobiales bacterium]|nr:hypothetical protein [Verrucomicrobiales bacterium]
MRDRGGDSGLETDHTFGADDLQAEGAGGFFQSSTTPKGRVDAGVHRELRGDVIAKHRADSVAGGFFGIAELGCFATLPDAGVTPRNVATEEAHDVEDVQTEDHHVLSTGARSHLADGVDFKNVANQPFLQSLLQSNHDRSHSGDVGDGDLPLLSRGELKDFVRLGKCHREWLFEVNMRADVQGRHRHCVMFAGPTRGDRDKIRFFLGEHLAIVGVITSGLAVRLCLGAARVVWIGDRNDFDVRQAVEDEVHTMAKIPGAGMADDGGLAFGLGGRRQVQRDGCRGRDTDEFAPVPVLHHQSIVARDIHKWEWDYRDNSLMSTTVLGCSSIGCDSRLLSMHRIAVVFLLTLLGVSVTAGSEPIRIVDGLFKSTDLKPIAGEHVEIHHATEESGFRFSHHPGLVVFKNRLYCSWSNGRAHEDRPDQRVLYSFSDDGKTWSESKILSQPPKGTRDSHIAAGFHVNGDKLTAYYTVRYDYPTHNLYNPKNALYAITSTNGSNWSRPTKIASGFYIEAPRPLANGRLFLGGEHAGDKWKTHQARMRLWFSDNPNGIGGWKEAAIHPAAAQPRGLKVFGYTEPCPYVRDNGVIVCPFRNSSGYLYASMSRDNGATWSVPEQTNFPDSMARINTGRLPDGQTYLINNPGPGKMNRGKLTIALSIDGQLFDRAWVIRSEPTTQRFTGKGKRDGWQYPTAVVWRNSLCVAYSVNKEDIALTHIPLKSLK